MDQTPTAELPDLFLSASGRRIQALSDWPQRRKEMLDTVVSIEYGGLPPTPARTTAEELHRAAVRRYEGVRYITLRVVTGPERPFSFLLYLLVPPGQGPFPVVITGDGCWKYVSDQVEEEALRRGYALAVFNRVEIVPDAGSNDRTSGLYLAYPEETFGALAAWAWGYHRCVDVLTPLDFVDAGRIAIIGHSRGGKTTLLAGATDERIAVTGVNNSGSGGAGCFRWQGEGSEKISDSVGRHTYWYGPRLPGFVGRVEELPFDQHFLKAAVAPRALVTLEALGDLWANPTGTLQTYRAAREAYRFLGVEEKIGTVYREGGHNLGLEDWQAFLDFADWHLMGREPARCFNPNPFPDLPPAFSWSRP